MDKAQPQRRPVRPHKPPSYLADYQTSLPCGPREANPATHQPAKPPANPQPTETLDGANKAQAPSAGKGLTAEKSSASGVQLAPPPKLSTTSKERESEGETATSDMDVMKGEIEQLKGLILNLGKTVQALGERVERQFYSASSNSSHSSCSSVHDCPDHSPELCVQRNPPPIVKELQDKLCEHNIPLGNREVKHPSPPAPSRICSLPPPPDSQGPTPQLVRPRSAQATQTSGNSSGEQPYLEASSEPTGMQHTCCGASTETYHVGPPQPSSHVLRPAPHLSQAFLNLAVPLSGRRTPSAGQHTIRQEPLPGPPPIPAQIPAQIPAPIPAQNPVPIPALSLAPIPAQIPVHIPAPTPAPIPVQIPAPTPALLPAQIPAPILTNIPALALAPPSQSPQLVMPPPGMDLTSSATEYANASYAQVPYMHPQTAGNPPALPYRQPHAPLYYHQSSSVAADRPPSLRPQATLTGHYLCPPTAAPPLNVQNVDAINPYNSVLQYQPQQLPRTNRVSHVAAPSFPYFTRDEPRQFALLKMALTNLLPHDESEQFKYHVLLDHLKLDTACHLALAYAHHPLPYTRAMSALQQRYGQPQQLVLKEIMAIQNLPSVRHGDSRSFSDFAIRVRALVGMLQSLENGEGDAELACASHVQQLLGKLPSEHVANFARFTRATKPGIPYNLVDFSNWLEEEAECQAMATQTRAHGRT